jgi:hypothetical protein
VVTWGVVKGARKGAFILIEHSRRELRLTPLAFSAIFFFVSVPELSLIRFQPGSTRNSVQRHPPLPCFYPHSEWAASGPGAIWGPI